MTIDEKELKDIGYIEDPTEIKVEFIDPKNDEHFINLDKEYNEFVDSNVDKDYKKEQKQKVTEENVEFVIDTMSKEAKHDKPSIKQLFYGMNSAFTKIPIPHNVNSKNSGSGKSYLLNLVAEYFPSKSVMILAGASSKAFHHKEGVMVIRNVETGELEEVEPKIEKLEDELEELDSEKDKARIREIEKNIKYLKRHQQKLIDLDNTIIIIQDTPEDSLLVNLMSLSSQDSSHDQEYIFADKSSSGKIISGSNIIRGMPVIFTTRVVDDTRHERFEETNRRSINVTPNVSKEKIDAANNLIGNRYGLLPEEYDEKVASKEDKEKAKMIVSQIVEKLINHSKFLNPKESGIRVPFAESISHSIPSDNVWSMTVMERLMRYLSIVTKVNMDSRPRYVNIKTGAFYPISTFQDLKETLHLMERGASSIRQYIAEWYNQVFAPSYQQLSEPNAKVVYKDGHETVVAQEVHLGLTTNELAEKTKEILKIPKPSSDEILKKYLYPLLNQGIIDKEQSQVNKNNNIYFPSDTEQKSIFSLFANNPDQSQDLKLKVNDPAFYPSINVLAENLTLLEKHHANGCIENNKIYRLEDSDGKEITTKQLIERYLSNADLCFVE